MIEDVRWIDQRTVKREVAKWAAGKPAVKRVLKVGESLKSGGKIDLAIAVDKKAIQAEHGHQATWDTFAGEWHTELSAVIPYALDVRQLVGGRDPITGKTANEAEQLYITQAIHRRESLFGGVFFLGFAALEAWVFQSGELERKAEWVTWLVGISAIGFLAAGIFSLLAWAKNWSPEDYDVAGTKTWNWVVGTPLVIGGGLLALWLSLSAFGWLTSIPAWAAVIIVLLVLLLLKK